MITAHQAARRSMDANLAAKAALLSQHKDVMDAVEATISAAADLGKYEAELIIPEGLLRAVAEALGKRGFVAVPVKTESGANIRAMWSEADASKQDAPQ